MSGGAAPLPGPGATGGPRRSWVTVAVCGVLPAALTAAAAVVPAALWPRLPARIPDHWTLAGTANGFAPKLVAFLPSGVLALLGLGIAWGGWAAAARKRATGTGGGAALVTLGLFLTALGAATASTVAAADLGGGGPRSASLGAGGLAGLTGGPLLLALLAGWLLRRYGGLGDAGSGEPPTSLGLGPGERAAWSGRARARWAWPAGTLLATGGIAAGAWAGQWALAVVPLATGAALLGFTSVRVTVAARGVTVSYGALGLRLTRIPLRRIARAEAVQRSAPAFGYRGSLLVLGAAAVIVRRGPALRLTLRDGKTFVVTVDDAATGAALLNDLIAAS